MDAYGIGAAIEGAAKIYLQTARGTGRTTALVESLKTGDRVVFIEIREAGRVKSLCRELGVDIETIVVNPKTPEGIFKRGTPPGRTVFDHSFVEQFYLEGIAKLQRDLDYLQRESSGFGMEHVETRMKAREMVKWHY